MVSGKNILAQNILTQNILGNTIDPKYLGPKISCTQNILGQKHLGPKISCNGVYTTKAVVGTYVYAPLPNIKYLRAPC